MTQKASIGTTSVVKGLVELVSEFFADPPLMYKLLRELLQDPSKAKRRRWK
jgi:hypothetical protein